MVCHEVDCKNCTLKDKLAFLEMAEVQLEADRFVNNKGHEIYSQRLKKDPNDAIILDCLKDFNMQLKCFAKTEEELADTKLR